MMKINYIKICSDLMVVKIYIYIIYFEGTFHKLNFFK